MYPSTSGPRNQEGYDSASTRVLQGTSDTARPSPQPYRRSAVSPKGGADEEPNMETPRPGRAPGRVGDYRVSTRPSKAPLTGGSGAAPLPPTANDPGTS